MKARIDDIEKITHEYFAPYNHTLTGEQIECVMAYLMIHLIEHGRWYTID